MAIERKIPLYKKKKGDIFTYFYIDKDGIYHEEKEEV